MPLYQVNVQVFDEYAGLVPSEWLRRVAEEALAVESWDYPVEMDLAIVDGETVRKLNNQYRGLDEDTDVLSFSLLHQGTYYGPGQSPGELGDESSFVVPPGRNVGLGEVVMSYPRAQRQAEESGHSIERELAQLITHGVLHLLGYDHEEPEEEAAMKEKEARIMSAVLE